MRADHPKTPALGASPPWRAGLQQALCLVPCHILGTSGPQGRGAREEPPRTLASPAVAAGLSVEFVSWSCGDSSRVGDLTPRRSVLSQFRRSGAQNGFPWATVGVWAEPRSPKPPGEDPSRLHCTSQGSLSVSAKPPPTLSIQGHL